jgi:hypothetical protein
MTLSAHVHNGTIVLDEPRELPEGTAVLVQVVSEKSKTADSGQPPSLYERLAPVIGAVSGLPSDLSINHDHYLYGTDKKQ